MPQNPVQNLIALGCDFWFPLDDATKTTGAAARERLGLFASSATYQGTVGSTIAHPNPLAAGNCATTNGTNNHINLGTLGAFGSRIGTGNGFTISFWVRCPQAANMGLFGLRATGGERFSMDYVHAQNRLDMYYAVPAGSESRSFMFGPQSYLSTTAWRHVTIVYEHRSGIMAIYYDGEQRSIAQRSTFASAGLTTANFTNNLLIGAMQLNGAASYGGNAVAGDFADVILASRALSSHEVRQLFGIVSTRNTPVSLLPTFVGDVDSFAAAARTMTVRPLRVAVMGDSTSTPTGQGRLLAASVATIARTSLGGHTPGWQPIGSTPADAFNPANNFAATIATSGNVSYTFGDLANATNSASAWPGGLTDYFDWTQGATIDIIARRSTGTSGGLNWSLTGRMASGSQNDTVANHTIASGTVFTSAELSGAVATSFASASIPLTAAQLRGFNFFTLTLSNPSATNTTIITSYRVRPTSNMSQPGVEMTYVSNGGIAMWSWSSSFSSSLPAVALMQPDVIVVPLGTNDVGTRTQAQIESDVATFVALVRASIPNVPIMFVPPPIRGDDNRLNDRSSTILGAVQEYVAANPLSRVAGFNQRDGTLAGGFAYGIHRTDLFNTAAIWSAASTYNNGDIVRLVISGSGATETRELWRWTGANASTGTSPPPFSSWVRHAPLLNDHVHHTEFGATTLAGIMVSMLSRAAAHPSATVTPQAIVNAINADTTIGGLRDDVNALQTGVVVSNVEFIVSEVWSASDRTLSEPADVSTTSITNIANEVWTADTRTLTSAVDVDAVAIAEDVWTYGTRTLTSGVTVTTPAQQFGSRTLVAGDDYGTDARSFIATLGSGAEWPSDLSDYTWDIYIAKSVENEVTTSPASVDGSVAVINATGSSRSVRVTIDGADTEDCTGLYDYAIRGVDGGVTWTIETGVIRFVKQV